MIIPEQNGGRERVVLNTRQNEQEPDIEAVDHPVVHEVVATMAKLQAQEITPLDYQRAIGEITRDPQIIESLASWIEKAKKEKHDQVLYRRTGRSHREAMQLFYLDKNVLHPPHCHHNILSTQLILSGRIYAREYDRVARLSEDLILLKLRTDGWLGAGDAIRATEVEKNCHWFECGDEPAVMLNINAYGYQDWTFNPKDRPLLRNLVDPTISMSADGLPLAREISVDEAYKKFGGRSLSEFPVS